MAKMNAVGSPLEFPTFTIDGETLELRFSFLAEYVLDEAGISMQMVHSILKRPGPGKVGIFMKLFAACVAHNYVARDEKVPAAEYWATKVTTAEQFKQMCEAVTAALVKAKPPVETIPLNESEAKLGSELKQ